MLIQYMFSDFANINTTHTHLGEINNNVFDNEKGYQVLKALIHWYYRLQKTFSQENNRLIATCDVYSAEL